MSGDNDLLLKGIVDHKGNLLVIESNRAWFFKCRLDSTPEDDVAVGFGIPESFNLGNGTTGGGLKGLDGIG